MNKILSLTVANLKGFTRDFKSVMILLVIPLFLIFLIFVSFNPNGLQKIPAGVVIEGESDFNVFEYQDGYLSYMNLFYSQTLDSCLKDLKSGKVYVCIVVKDVDVILFDIYYDNTREPVIWEVIQRIDTSVKLLQKEKSLDMANSFIYELEEILKRTEQVKSDLANTDQDIEDYILEVDGIKDDLRSVKTDLTIRVDNAREGINDIEESVDELDDDVDDLYGDVSKDINKVQNQLDSLSNLTSNQIRIVRDAEDYVEDLDNSIKEIKNDVDDTIYKIRTQQSSFENDLNDQDQYLDQIDRYITELDSVVTELNNFRKVISDYIIEVESIQDKLSGLNNVNTENLVNPIKLESVPVYVPEVPDDFTDSEELTGEDVVRGINLISLQTLYPTILFMVVLFLSLLISSFISLKFINSSSYTRLKLVKNIMFPETISIYLSSLIITIIPITCILLLGDELFRIDILANFFSVIVTLFLVISIFILIGMLLAYVIEKKSTTLLVTTFTLIGFMFFSGLLFPVERMSAFIGHIVRVLPGTLGIALFKKEVFYYKSLSFLASDIILLWFWLLVLAIILFFVRVFKE